MAVEPGFGTPPDDYRQHHTDVTHPNAGEREFETGKDEAWFANVKSRYDEYLQGMAELRDLTRGHIGRLHVMAEQAIQNFMVQSNALNVQVVRMATNEAGTDNLTNKQATAHRDIAIDREWNLNETDLLGAQTYRAADEHAQGWPHSHSPGGNPAGSGM